MKVGDLVTFKNISDQESYGAGVLLEKYHSSDDYGFVVFFTSYDVKVHVRQEELEVINESR